MTPSAPWLESLIFRGCYLLTFTMGHREASLSVAVSIMIEVMLEPRLPLDDTLHENAPISECTV